MEKKKMYVAPLTKKTVVELEQGFMSASIKNKDEEIFNNHGHDGGVSIDGHKVGNEGSYSLWDFEDNSFNS